ITTGAGALGWRRPAGGVLSLDFDADSLNSLDSLVAWVVGRDTATVGRGRSLKGSARVLLTLEGAFDSVAVEARANAARLAWRGVVVGGTDPGHGQRRGEPGRRRRAAQRAGLGTPGSEGRPADPRTRRRAPPDRRVPAGGRVRPARAGYERRRGHRDGDRRP